MLQEINAPWRTEPSWRELPDKTWAPTENTALLDSTGKILATVWTGTRLPTSREALSLMRAAPGMLDQLVKAMQALRRIQNLADADFDAGAGFGRSAPEVEAEAFRALSEASAFLVRIGAEYAYTDPVATEADVDEPTT